ncbi:MAG: cation:proton antiporter, partial [Candidatus Bathyarchaeia archaeon]
DITTISQSIASRFSTGIVLGAAFGLIWLSILKRVKKATYSYMLTLAVVILAYAFTEFLGGSGALCSLLFGVMLGNEREIYKILRIEKPSNSAVDAGLKRFESEVAFLLRTFFFVFIGLMVSIRDLNTVIIGVILSLLILLIRFGSVTLATLHSNELVKERPLMVIMLTRGLAAAVLATLPLQYSNAEAIQKYGDPAKIFSEISYLYINLAVLIILSTAIIATVGIPLLRWRAKRNIKN